MTARALPLLALCGLLLAPASARDQQQNAAPANPNELRAFVSLQPEKSMEVILLGGTPRSLAFRPPDLQSGSVMLPPDKVLWLRVVLPDAARAGLEAFGRGEWATAARGLGPTAVALLPYTSVRNSDALAIFMAYADSLRHLGQIDPALALFQQLRSSPVPDVRRLGTLWMAYLSLRKGQSGLAAKLLENAGQPGGETELDGLSRLVESYVRLSEKKPREALDAIAQLLAFGGLEWAIYPEGLFLAASSYELVAFANATQAATEREESIKRALLAERIRIGRELAAAARQAGQPPPSEAAILAKLDEKAIAATVPPSPPAEADENYRVAQESFEHLAKAFPSTPWGQQAKSKFKGAPPDSSSNPTSNDQ